MGDDNSLLDLTRAGAMSEDPGDRLDVHTRLSTCGWFVPTSVEAST
jgi:hypothetical protein